MKNIPFYIDLRIIAISVASTLITSCETVIDADLPLHKLAITLNGTIHPDTTVQVHLSENKFILDGNYDFKVISNATVKLYAGTTLIGQLQQDDSTEMYVLDYYPDLGIEYTVTAEKEGLDKVKATDIIPASLPQAELVSVQKQNRSGYDELYELTYTLDDPVGADYYETRLFRLGENYDYYRDSDTSYYYSKGKVLQEVSYDKIGAELNEFENERSPYLFSDELFDGQEEEIRIGFYNYRNYYYGQETQEESDTFKMYVVVRKVSESYYKYKISRQLQNDVSGNIFAEPAPVYNNIENGFGIFAGYNTKSIEFQIISSED